jgi:peptidoglycan/LPS O-acetylase OafA/YrhL
MAQNNNRLEYLQSIRGLAAIQVLISHLVLAYFPLLIYAKKQEFETSIHHSPLYFLYDGNAAVDTFFILSGLVLTISFSKIECKLWKVLCSRYIRLSLPALAACSVSFFAIAYLGRPNIDAGKVTGSVWLSQEWQTPNGVAFFFKDVFLNGLLLGYKETSVWRMLGSTFTFDSIYTSYIPPMWTLSIEFIGSILVLIWTMIYRKSIYAWLVVVALSSVFFFFTHFICFAIGHLLGATMRDGRLMKFPWLISIALISVGFLICVGSEIWTSFDILDGCKNASFFSLPCTPKFQQTIGATLLFLGIVSFEPAIKILSLPSLKRLGDLSFSIYLIHWPVLIGFGSFLFLSVQNTIGIFTAKILCALFVASAAYLVAIPFSRIDRLSINLSKRVKA